MLCSSHGYCSFEVVLHKFVCGKELVDQVTGRPETFSLCSVTVNVMKEVFC